MTNHPPELNRRLRRMLARHQRRPKHQPRTIVLDTVRLAMSGAGAITAAERDLALAPARAAFKALREGVATFEQWDALDSVLLIAIQIEELGIVRGLREHLQAAATALAEIRRRVDAVGAWGSRTTLYFQEIEALREALHLVDFQLQNLSLSELQQAANRAANKIRGRAHPVTAADTLPQPKQERLL